MLHRQRQHGPRAPFFGREIPTQTPYWFDNARHRVQSFAVTGPLHLAPMWQAGVEHTIERLGTWTLHSTLTGAASTRLLCRNFITEGRLQWSQTPDDGNTLYVNGEEPTTLPVRREDIYSDLAERFPEEKDAIRRIL